MDHHRSKPQCPDKFFSAPELIEGIRAAAQNVVKFFFGGQGRIGDEILGEFQVFSVVFRTDVF